MRLSKKYSVPAEISLLYEFLNSTDERRYYEKGQQHVPSDHLETPAQLDAWMGDAGLSEKTGMITSADRRHALDLRAAIRSFVQIPPESRAKARAAMDRINKISGHYPLVMRITHSGDFALQPAHASQGLGRIVAELYGLATSGRLDRLKMCNSPECHWVFFDRSKPGSRKWCSSLVCGNRQKTRDYRRRAKAGL